MKLLRRQNGELNAFGTLVRKSGIGRLVYHAYYRPRAWMQRRSYADAPIEIPLFGYRFVAPSPRSNHLSAALVQNGVWEPEVTAAVEETVKPGMCVVNVGADLGYYVLLVASRNAGGPILAFEPNSINEPFLRQNVESNDLKSAKIVQAALGNSETEILLRTDEFRLEVVKASSAQGAWVRMFRFDQLPEDLRIEGNPRIDFVIVDVEGAELEVLRGMEETLVRDRPTLLVEVHGPLLHHFGTTKQEFFDWIGAKGYDARWIAGDPLSGEGFSHVLLKAGEMHRQ